MVAPRGTTVERERYATIEGQKVLVVERKPPLPRRLEDLLGAMGTRKAYTVRFRDTSVDCDSLREHPFTPLREGSYLGMDIRVDICPLCRAVCVRDVSYDRSVDGEAVAVARGGARRRNHILGWYSGKRRAGREYR